MSKLPLFTIIIPTYNRASAVTRAIDSVLQQTFSDFELIIIDDGSTDDTKEKITAIADPRLRYIYQKNQERSAARNHGIRLAKGEYITFLDSDDEALPNWLATFAKIVKTPKIGVACVGYTEIRQKNGQMQNKDYFPENLGPIFENQVCLFWPAGTFAIHRRWFDIVGDYIVGMSFAENTELAIRLVSACLKDDWQVVSVNEPMITYYKEDHSGASSPKQSKVVFKSIMYILNHHPHQLKKSPRVHGYYWAMAGVNAARLGQYATAKTCFLSAIKSDSRNVKHYCRFLLSMFPPIAKKFWGWS